MQRKRRRTVFVSVGLLAMLAAGGIVFSIVERTRDIADRAT